MLTLITNPDYIERPIDSIESDSIDDLMASIIDSLLTEDQKARLKAYKR